jgi:hypothetical protein
MAKGKTSASEILAQLSKICRALPEAEQRDTSDHADFRVCGRVFACASICRPTSAREVGLVCALTERPLIGPRCEIWWN